MIIPFAEQLRSRLAKSAESEATDQLLREIYTSYVGDYVGPRPTQNNLVMPFEKCSLGYCGDCQYLEAFMRSESESTTHKAGKQRRDHVDTRLFHYGDSVSVKTVEKGVRGKPNSLIITKHPEARQEARLQPWLEKAAEAKVVITAIPEDQGKRFLGGSFFTTLPEGSMKAIFGESFEAIWRLRPDDLSAAQPDAETPATPTQTMGQTSTVPAKRKAAVDTVDLTDE